MAKEIVLSKAATDRLFSAIPVQLDREDGKPAAGSQTRGPGTIQSQHWKSFMEASRRSSVQPAAGSQTRGTIQSHHWETFTEASRRSSVQVLPYNKKPHTLLSWRKHQSELSLPSNCSSQVDFEPPPQENKMSDHYTHSLNDFKVFTGCTYKDILTEVKKWLEPLLAKPDLHKAFLEFINHCTPPNIHENLQKLSKYLKQLCDALHTDRDPSPNKDTELTPILQALSSDQETELEQTTAIILAAEACSEFPLHTLQKMFALDQEKRTIVLKLVKTTPHATNRHVFIDEGPFEFNDPDLYPVLSRMGYSCSVRHLIYAADDVGSNMLAAGSTVIMIAPPLPPSTQLSA